MDTIFSNTQDRLSTERMEAKNIFEATKDKRDEDQRARDTATRKALSESIAKATDTDSASDKRGALDLYKISRGGKFDSNDEGYFGAGDENNVWKKLKHNSEPMKPTKLEIEQEAFNTSDDAGRLNLVRNSEDGTSWYSSQNAYSEMDDAEAIKQYEKALNMKNDKYRLNVLRSNMSDKARESFDIAKMRGSISANELGQLEVEDQKLLIASLKTYLPKSERGDAMEFFNRISEGIWGGLTTGAIQAAELTEDIFLHFNPTISKSEKGMIYNEALKRRSTEAKVRSLEATEYNEGGAFKSAVSGLASSIAYGANLSNPYTGTLAFMAMSKDMSQRLIDDGVSPTTAHVSGMVASSLNLTLERFKWGRLGKAYSKGALASTLGKFTARQIVLKAGKQWTIEVGKEMAEEIGQAGIDYVVEKIAKDENMTIAEVKDVIGMTIGESAGTVMLFATAGRGASFLKRKNTSLDLDHEGHVVEKTYSDIAKDDKDYEDAGNIRIGKLMSAPIAEKKDAIIDAIVNSELEEAEMYEALDELDAMSDEEIADAYNNEVNPQVVADESVADESVESIEVVEQTPEQRVEVADHIVTETSKDPKFLAWSEKNLKAKKAKHIAGKGKRSIRKKKHSGRMSALPIDVIAYLAYDMTANVVEITDIAIAQIINGTAKNYKHLKDMLVEGGVSDKDANKIASKARKELSESKSSWGDQRRVARTKVAPTAEQEVVNDIIKVRADIKNQLRLSKSDKAELKALGIKIPRSALANKSSKTDGMYWDVLIQDLSDDVKNRYGLDSESTLVDLFEALYSQDIPQMKKDANKELQARSLKVGQVFSMFPGAEDASVVVHKFKSGGVLVNVTGKADGDIVRYDANGIVTESALVENRESTEEELKEAQSRQEEYLSPNFFKIVKDVDGDIKSTAENMLDTQDSFDYIPYKNRSKEEQKAVPQTKLDKILSAGVSIKSNLTSLATVIAQEITSGGINTLAELDTILNSFNIAKAVTERVSAMAKKKLTSNKRKQITNKAVSSTIGSLLVKAKAKEERVEARHSKRIEGFIQQVVRAKRHGKERVEATKGKFKANIAQLRADIKEERQTSTKIMKELKDHIIKNTRGKNIDGKYIARLFNKVAGKSTIKAKLNALDGALKAFNEYNTADNVSIARTNLEKAVKKADNMPKARKIKSEKEVKDKKDKTNLTEEEQITQDKELEVLEKALAVNETVKEIQDKLKSDEKVRKSAKNIKRYQKEKDSVATTGKRKAELKALIAQEKASIANDKSAKSADGLTADELIDLNDSIKASENAIKKYKKEIDKKAPTAERQEELDTLIATAEADGNKSLNYDTEAKLQEALADLKSAIKVGKTVKQIKRAKQTAFIAEKRAEFLKSDLGAIGRLAKKVTLGLTELIANYNLLPHLFLKKLSMGWIYKDLRLATSEKLELEYKWRNTVEQNFAFMFDLDKNGKPTILKKVYDAMKFGKSKLEFIAEMDVSEALFVYAHSMSEDGRAYLKNTGFTVDEINALKRNVDAKIPEAKSAIMKNFRLFDEVFELANDVHEADTGKRMDKVEYYIMIHGLKRYANSEMEPGSYLDEMSSKEKGASVSDSTTKTRVGSKRAFIKMDYFHTMDVAITKNANYIAMRETASVISRFISDIEVQEKLENFIGSHGIIQKILRQTYNDRIDTDTKVNKFVNFLRGATTMSTLGIKASTMLKQGASIANSAVEMANALNISKEKAMMLITQELTAGLAGNNTIVIDGKDIKIEDYILEVGVRLDGTGGSLSIDELRKSLGTHKQVEALLTKHGITDAATKKKLGYAFDKYKKMVDVSMVGISAVDKVVSTAVARATYKEAIALGKSDADARYDTIEVTYLSQPSHDMLSMSDNARSENALFRAYSQFLSMPSKAFNQLYNSATTKSPVEFVHDFVYASLIPATMMFVMSALRPPEDEEDALAIFDQLAMGIMGGMTGGGNLYKYAFGNYGQGEVKTLMPAFAQIIGQQSSKVIHADSYSDKAKEAFYLSTIFARLPQPMMKKTEEIFTEDKSPMTLIMSNKNSEAFSEFWGL